MAISTTRTRHNARFWGFHTVELLVIGFVALYPLLANPFASPVFGLPKLTLLKLTALAIGLAWVGRALRQGYATLPRTGLGAPLFALVAATAVSGILSVHPMTSLLGQYGRWEGITTSASYLVLFAAAYGTAGNPAARKPLFLAAIGAAAAVSLIAIAEHLWTNPYLLLAHVYCAAGFGEPNRFETGRSMASFGNATLVAAYLAMMLPLSVAALLDRERRLAPRPVLFGALLVIAAALLLTFGRGAWLGALAGVVLTTLLLPQTLRSARRDLAIMLALIAIAIVFVQATSSTYTLTGRMASMFSVDGSTLARVQMWDASLPLVAERPLFGSGPDTFKYVFGTYKPEGWVEHISDPLVDRAHNESLQLAVTLGLTGLTAYLWMLVTLIWSGITRRHKAAGGGDGWLIAGGLGAVLAFAVQLQFNFSHFAVSPFFWILAGLSGGLLEQARPRRTFELDLGKPTRVTALGVLAIAGVALGALVVAPLAADIRFAQGRELQAGHELEGALLKYESAAALNSREPLYRLSLGEVLIKLGARNSDQRRIDLGIREFTLAQKLNPLDEHAYFRAGAVLLEAGRTGRHQLLEQSIEQHMQGLARNPVMVDAYVDIGVAHAYVGRFDEAIEAWRDALKVEPDNDRAYFNLGWGYERMGDTARAREAYLRAYRLNPKMTEAKDAYDRL